MFLSGRVYVEELSSRRFHTVNRLKEVRSELHTLAANRVRGKACVYATGSFGRCEASPHSEVLETTNADEQELLKRFPGVAEQTGWWPANKALHQTRRQGVPASRAVVEGRLAGEGRCSTALPRVTV